MKQFASFGALPSSLTVAVGMLPDTPRGRQYAGEGGYHYRARLPSDPVGITTVVLTNIVPGSRYRIERQDTDALASPEGAATGVAASSTVEVVLDLYAAGNAGNDVRIKVRKGTSAPKYQPFQTLAQLSAASQSVYVAQVPDTIA